MQVSRASRVVEVDLPLGSGMVQLLILLNVPEKRRHVEWVVDVMCCKVCDKIAFVFVVAVGVVDNDLDGFMIHNVLSL